MEINLKIGSSELKMELSMEERLELLITAANNYYNGKDLIMDDQSYDKLLSSIKESDPSFNIFDHITIIGEDRASMPHPLPYTQQEFKTSFDSMESFKKMWDEVTDYILTYKFDGTSITAYYNNGKLYNILTRSDETYGKKKLDQLRNKVKQEVDPDVLKIDYECTCCREDFPEDTRSNSNGLINSCYKQEEVDKYITAIPFKVTTKTKEGYIESFLKAGFSEEDLPVVHELPVFEQRYIEYKSKHYPIDGFVGYNKFDNTVSHKIWKHYGNQEIQTTVTDIEWNESDYLSWVPKIIIDPIYLDGRTISRTASGGISSMVDKRCGVGSEVYIYLANSTIPQIGKVVIPSDDFHYLEKCPYCGGKVGEVQNKLRCLNSFCSHSFNYIIREWMNSFINKEFIDSHIEDINKIDTIDSFKAFIKSNNLEVSIDNIVNIPYGLPIERFKKYNEAIEVLRENINLIKSERSIKSINMYMYTYNQYEIFKMYIPIIDAIIDRVLLS